MITQDVLDGKKVIMVYLKGDFCPATDADATFVKEIYEDGRVVFSSCAVYGAIAAHAAPTKDNGLDSELMVDGCY